MNMKKYRKSDVKRECKVPLGDLGVDFLEGSNKKSCRSIGIESLRYE
jgi:hypothetical protein